MAVTKIRKISSWTLLICSLISIIILGMFFAGGVVDPAAETSGAHLYGVADRLDFSIVLCDNH